ncbi:MAG TPA: nicotinate-nucleotide--dimethylbenzimidazole phosphoribosyltransferase [Chitinophagaceae bacterium]|jgi:nicotinate-nucleotide--dimethylbenzimidazole phosphoribosyltransferase|nr:nicotinate-nucleotide--dimethylbenzimidazole phosphoribosyltransferase [Chitinophagaceae bacterium]
MSLSETLRHKIDRKTKPPGALGRLEEIAVQVGLIQGTDRPELRHPHLIVFAGDHGIAATGLVNPYPQAVTAQMVRNFLQGGAAINVFCRQHGLRLLVVDAGVCADWTEEETGEHFLCEKIGYGTRNYLLEPAMTAGECSLAIERGRAILRRVHGQGCNIVGLGEMGIGNTSSASLLMHFLTGLPLDACVGRGTGADNGQLDRKRITLAEAAARHRSEAHADRPLEVLRRIGGFEIAMMAGACLEAAALGMTLLVDGFIATAALLVAQAIDPSVLSACLFTHVSGEQGHAALLRYLGAEPLLQLGLRLGEGTGAALAFPLVQSAVLFLNEMASFEEAGVSTATP